MYVWPRGHAGNRSAKSRKRNAIAAQVFHQRLPFRPVRIQRDVHRVTMVEMPLVVNRALSEHGDRQWPFECLLKKNLDLSRLRKHPRSRAAVTNERSCFDDAPFPHASQVG